MTVASHTSVQPQRFLETAPVNDAGEWLKIDLHQNKPQTVQVTDVINISNLTFKNVIFLGVTD